MFNCNFNGKSKTDISATKLLRSATILCTRIFAVCLKIVRQILKCRPAVFQIPCNLLFAICYCIMTSCGFSIVSLALICERKIKQKHKLSTQSAITTCFFFVVCAKHNVLLSIIALGLKL